MRALPVLLALAALAAGCTGSGTTTTRPPEPKPLAVYADGVRLARIVSDRQTIRLPHSLSIRRGRARIAVHLPLHRVKAAIRTARRANETRLDVPVVPYRSSIALRPVRQVLHNDCEATSLSILLTGAGIHVGQLRLQERLPRSGPLDPEPVPGSTLFRWGDPERGFVGRPAGGGTEGGFGVYEPPIRALAARYGVHLRDLRGESIRAVRSVVLSGKPVLAWVGLAPGPYLSWLTPSGRKITVNLDEHAVVLVGAGPGYVLVDNPLTGLRERWSESLFDERWSLLGHRALALP